MNSSFNFTDVITIIGIVQGLFIGISLFMLRFFKNQSNKYFAICILGVTTLIFFGWWDTDEPFKKVIWSVRWELMTPIALFTYFIKELKHPFDGKPWLKLLYLPFIIFSSISLSLSFDCRLGIYELSFFQNSEGLKFYTNMISYFSKLFNFGIIIWLYVLVVFNKKLSRNKKKWLKEICIASFILVSLWSLVSLLYDLFDIDIWILFWPGLSLVLLWICYKGVFQLKLLDHHDEIHSLLTKKKSLVSVTNRKKNPDKNTHLVKLDSLMAKQELFKNPDLSRARVAEQLKLSNGYLSQLLSNELKTNFTDYINKHRVELAKKMLSNLVFDKYSIEAVGIEAGFKSKSAFYKAFQKFVGQSPGAFKKEIRLV